MIKLGISSCFLYPDRDRKYFGPKTLCYLENDMATYLTQNGVLPILIPDLKGDQMSDLLEELDGLVLQGGSDLSPLSYQEEFLDQQKWPGDAYRDQYEFGLVKYFLEKKRPILGICRGAQLLNAYFGGTLFQDISSELETNIKHRDAMEYDNVHHEIEILTDSILSQLYPQKRGVVNSVHHQGIKTLGHGLKIEATSVEDGMIEAISHINMDEQWVFAVQWHPEFSYCNPREAINSTPLLTYFLERLKK